MGKSTGKLRVHLDHFIPRQSIRYVPSTKKKRVAIRMDQELAGQQDRTLRYDDIRRRDGWFTLIYKPDFQRETNAWTPEDCVEFLNSIVKGRIIPSIILWRSPETNFVYVLDGAHRLSVIRAWMLDDWGDKAGDYYERRNQKLIKDAANRTRELIAERQIGFFRDFESAWRQRTDIINEGKAPKHVMRPQLFNQAAFYDGIVAEHRTLTVQWERGDYRSAEQSFLVINRKGQALDPWEATLIEYRASSYARSIMCIANGGESGHYWPEPSDEDDIDAGLVEVVKSFGNKAAGIHKRLFIPPFRLPITSLNVPLMVAPAYFQKHKYLFEVIPLVVYGEIATAAERQLKIMKKDVDASAETIISNADRILSTMEEKLEHLISPTHSSKSLSIVPLFYWYNQKGQFARGLLYGFIFWLLAGSDEDITNRKVVFSANRDRFEYLLFDLKLEIATLQARGGAGLKATKRAADFFQKFLELLHNNPDLPVKELTDGVIEILQEYASITKRSPKAKSSRSYSRRDKTQINIRELFENAICCHICGGIVNLQHGGIQYDHTEDYATSKLTDPETGKPTHPFCNRHKGRIQAYRDGREKLVLPSFSSSAEEQKITTRQLTFWGEDDFPG